MSIRKQTPQVRKLLKKINKHVLPQIMCWTTAYPGVEIPGITDTPTRMRLVRRAIRKASSASDVDMPIIAERAMAELDYCTDLAVIVRIRRLYLTDAF